MTVSSGELQAHHSRPRIMKQPPIEPRLADAMTSLASRIFRHSRASREQCAAERSLSTRPPTTRKRKRAQLQPQSRRGRCDSALRKRAIARKLPRSRSSRARSFDPDIRARRHEVSIRRRPSGGGPSSLRRGGTQVPWSPGDLLHP